MTGGLIVAILSFCSAFFGIFAVNLVLVDLFKRDRERMLQRMEEERRLRQRKEVRESALARRDGQLSQLAQQALLEANVHQSWYDRLKEMVAQSGMRITTARLLMMSGMAGLFTGLVGGVLFRNVWIGMALAGIGLAVPIMVVSRARNKRQERLRAQFSDVLELMSRVLRAGQTVTQAMNAVSEEFKPPISSEFAYCYEQQNLGLAPEIAFKDLGQRTGILEIKIFVLAVLVHRQSGGNLAELFDKLSHIVRERFRIRGEIKTLTAEGRMQAVILLILPVGVWCALFVINQPYAMKLLEHPSLVASMIVSMGLGAYWIRAIVNFDF
ncbi:MAG: type II secretion system F family protein [Pirellulaceae bacterium]